MDLFAFIHHTDPTMVWIGEREVREGEVPLIELTMRHVVLLAGEDDQGDANTQDAGNDIVDEKGDDTVAAGQAEQGDHVVDFEGIDIVADDEIQALVTEQPKKVRKRRRAADGADGSGLPPKKLREDHGTSGDNGANVSRKSLAALQGLLDSTTLATKVGVTAATTVPFVTSFVTPTPEREDNEVTFIVRLSMSRPLVLTVVVTTTVVVGTTSALIHDSSMIDHLATPRFFSQLRAMDYEQLLVEFSVGVARQACFNTEIRMRLEHELRGRQKLEERCTLQTTCFGLRDVVAGYKLFKDQVEVVQDEQVKALNGRVAGIDVDLMNGGGALCHAIDKGMQGALVAGVDHGKARRGLKVIIVYDPSSKSNFVSAVNTFWGLSPSCTTGISKDASMVVIMDLLRLEGFVAETPEASQLQPSFKQLMIPIHKLEDQVIIGETSSSFALDVAHVRIQRLKGDDAACHLSLTNAMVRLLEPLSTKSVIGKASTSGIPATAVTTALYHLCLSQHRPSRTIY
nr:hypothetical protein [Tanacetum cinerariifolium]